MNVLVIDIGGSNIKILATGQPERIKIPSGVDFTPSQLVDLVQKATAEAGWKFEVVTVGFPGVVKQGKIVSDPVNLGKGWMGFDFEQAFGCPVKVVMAAAMQALGAQRQNIAAVIGPCISQAAYEVGPEFFETFTDDDPTTQRFFAQGQGDRMLFDLPAYGLHRLSTAGVGQAQWTRHCTYADPERFYSYRRTTHAGEADYGRLISIIRL